MLISEPPDVSVLMAVRNGGDHLRPAVQSILDQTFTRFEFVIVDDGSTDDTPAVLDSFTDPRIRRLHNPVNLGLPASLNRGLSACGAPLIARMDGDDLAEPARLAEQLDWLRARPHAAGCGTWTTEIDEHDAVIGFWRPSGHAAYLKFKLAFTNPIYHPTLLLRREAFDAVNGYDETYRYAQDYDLMTRLYAAGRDVGILEMPLLRYRRCSGSITRAHGGEQARLAEGIRRRYRTWLLGRALSPDAEAALDALMAYDRSPAPESLRNALDALQAVVDATVGIPGTPADARAAVEAEVLHLLRPKADRLLGGAPVLAHHYARFLRRLPGRRGEGWRLHARAALCALGRARRGQPQVASSLPDGAA
ncbi:MAG: glycosyltransferase family 2 protein [Phycisphaerae bacterium]